MPLNEFAACLIAAVEFHEPPIPLWVMELSLDVFLGAWLFFVGASVGSFLNVVVYRLPRGLNLVHPPSRCPSCLHAIRLWDNVPILSWLLLGGKCRDCRAPVSSRYFWIELLMGSVFLGVWLLEANLPPSLAAANAHWGWRAIPSPSSAAFWCAFALHVGLIATLIAGALIHADGFRTPPQLFAPILLLGLALPIAWPEARCFAAFPAEHLNHWQAGLIDGLAGVAAGALLALAGSLRWFVFGRAWPRFAPIALLTATGAVLGWQLLLMATPAIVVLYLAAGAALRLLGPLPDVPATPAVVPDAPLDQNVDPPLSSEPPLPAVPADRDLTP